MNIDTFFENQFEKGITSSPYLKRLYGYREGPYVAPSPRRPFVQRYCTKEARDAKYGVQTRLDGAAVRERIEEMDISIGAASRLCGFQSQYLRAATRNNVMGLKRLRQTCDVLQLDFDTIKGETV